VWFSHWVIIYPNWGFYTSTFFNLGDIFHPPRVILCSPVCIYSPGDRFSPGVAFYSPWVIWFFALCWGIISSHAGYYSVIHRGIYSPHWDSYFLTPGGYFELIWAIRIVFLWGISSPRGGFVYSHWGIYSPPWGIFYPWGLSSPPGVYCPLGI
jgi:hypothetical protein